MKTTRPLVVLRLDVWRDRVYFLLAWCGVYVEAWTPADAPGAYLSAIGSDVVRAIEDCGVEKGTYTYSEAWIRHIVHRQVAAERATHAIDRARQPP